MTERTALVTGAAKRIGRAIGARLADAGWNVAVHYNASREEAEETAAAFRQMGVGAAAVQADLADAAEAGGLVAKAASALGPISILVNNASLFEANGADDFQTADWDRHLNVNLRAPALLAQAFARQLPGGTEGNIVNITDQRVWKLTPRFFSYTLSKAALWTMTETLAQSFAPRIRVNAVGPGPTLANEQQSEEEFAAVAAAMPLERSADPEDVAAAVLFLVENRSITGQMIAVDAGQHIAWETPDVLASSD